MRSIPLRVAAALSVTLWTVIFAYTKKDPALAFWLLMIVNGWFAAGVSEVMRSTKFHTRMERLS
jgi:hypothetical protein